MAIFWTQRMQEVVNAEQTWRQEHGVLPSHAELGRQLRLSATRVWQLRTRIDRYRRQPREYDDHIKRWRLLFFEALKVIQQAAKRQRLFSPKPRKPRPFDLALSKRAQKIILNLPLLGPHQTWPRHQEQGPSMRRFLNYRFAERSSRAAIEWYAATQTRGNMEKAREIYERNEMGLG